MARIEWNLESALKEAKKHKTRTEYATTVSGAYNWLANNKKMILLDKVFPKNRKKWSEKKVLKEIKKYKTRKNFRTKSVAAYVWLVKNKKVHLLDMFLTSERNVWSEKKVLEEIKRYKTRSEFQRKSGGAYGWLQKNKKFYLMDNMFPKKNNPRVYRRKSILKEEKMTKQKTVRLNDQEVMHVLSLMAKGTESKKIEKETHYTRQQIAAVKAHVTMGTYCKTK